MVKTYKSTKHELFVRTYLKHDNSQAVADELGISMGATNAKAYYLRKMGVKLPYKKYFIRDKQEFVDEMNDIIKALESAKKPNTSSRRG